MFNNDQRLFYEIEIQKPVPGPHDLLVSVQAVSINPVDTKMRSGSICTPDGVTNLGWDASGTVEAVGSAVTLFKPGQEVFYAGTYTRSGSNADYHLVDERIVGPKPVTLSFAEAAALPLTTLTAWELLFDRLGVMHGGKHTSGSLLIIGGAGGVGSILIQIARKLTGLTVIATASRPQSREWCLELGAHHVVDHSKSLVEEVAALNAPPITHIAALTHTARHYEALVSLIAPQGKIAIIDDHDSFDAVPLKNKSVSLHWEMVFTRPMYKTEDMIEQHHILMKITSLVDAHVLRSTLTRKLTPFCADSLKQAHALVEQGDLLGKVVVARD